MSRWSDLGQGMGITQVTVVELVPGQSQGLGCLGQGNQHLGLLPLLCHVVQPQEQLKV